jgi:hypothetical protein
MGSVENMPRRLVVAEEEEMEAPGGAAEEDEEALAEAAEGGGALPALEELGPMPVLPFMHITRGWLPSDITRNSTPFVQQPRSMRLRTSLTSASLPNPWPLRRHSASLSPGYKPHRGTSRRRQ